MIKIMVVCIINNMQGQLHLSKSIDRASIRGIWRRVAMPSPLLLLWYRYIIWGNGGSRIYRLHRQEGGRTTYELH